MMRRFLSATAIVTALALGWAGPNEAATPKGALGAIAVSPDGSTVAAAGDNHALYLLDPATLEVRQRIHLGVNPLEIWYSADGQTLALLNLDDEVRLLSTADWSVKAAVPNVVAAVHLPALDSLVLVGGASRSGGIATTPLSLLNLSDGSLALTASVNAELVAIAAKPDGSGFVALTKAAKDESEQKTETPKDLKGAAKETFELQHDGYSAELIQLDAAGLETGRVKTWYSQNGQLSGVHDGSRAYFVGYNNENLIVSADGTTFEVFQGPTSYNYGIGAAGHQLRVAVGGLRDGSIITLGDGASVTFELDDIPGWPEYFKAFAFAPDGSVYAGTTSYRLAHIGADGVLIAVKPVF